MTAEREEKILITDSIWQQIRDGFDEREKEQLRDAICGQTICPQGWTVDGAKLGATLSRKLLDKKTAIVQRGKARA